tara:strand:- start:4356 stop:5015 length:660 start_codon:yes stop_codon:yes gene_type:complete
MTSKHLKDENNEWVFGVNGKKLRFIIDKKEKKITAKFKKNWTDDAIDILEIKYDDYFIEYESNKRGRPSKNKTPKKVKRLKESKKANLIKTAATFDTSDEEEENMDIYFLPFDIGNRVKMLVSPYSCGEIINFDKDDKLVIVKMENDEVIRTSKNAIKKMRGRKPKAKLNKKVIEYDSNDDDYEILKYEGKVYIINKKNEVFDLNGNYIGEYINNELIT